MTVSTPSLLDCEQSLYFLHCIEPSSFDRVASISDHLASESLEGRDKTTPPPTPPLLGSFGTLPQVTLNIKKRKMAARSISFDPYDHTETKGISILPTELRQSAAHRVCFRRSYWRSETIECFSLGKNLYLYANIFYCLAPPTWPP